jgi:hypothetical protein
MTDSPLRPDTWPATTVTVTRAGDGVMLYFPCWRSWRFALWCAAIGTAMLVPALFAAAAFAPGGRDNAAAMLGFVLTATFVYPLILFGIAFLVVALFAVSTSLTVTASANGLRAVRRLLDIKISDRSLSRAAIAVLEQETQNVPRIFGGQPYFRVVALGTVPPSAGPDAGKRYGVKRLVVADGIADEALAQALEALISECAQLNNRTA